MHSQIKTTTKSPNLTQNIVQLMPKVPAIHNTYKFDVHVTNQVGIVQLLHSSKNAAVHENLNESGKKLL